MDIFNTKKILRVSNASFCRLPLSRNLEGVKIAILGIPFDLATTFRPGARFAPAAIREVSCQLPRLGSKAFPFGFNPFEIMKTIDYGDILSTSNNPAIVAKIIEEQALNIISHNIHLISFGGDHFVTYPLLRAHAKKYGPLALIHFDAHPDTWPINESSNDIEFNHGTMFYMATKEGLIIPEKSVQIGIRTWVDDKLGFNILDAMWVHDKGPKATVQEIKKIVGKTPTYLTFDIDCLDPAYAPGTGTPVVGGLTTHQALSILRSIDEI
ncbi:MAG: agmatinase, partial [Rickettsiales bacterium]